MYFPENHKLWTVKKMRTGVTVRPGWAVVPRKAAS
jgi:hypothetical protein